MTGSSSLPTACICCVAATLLANAKSVSARSTSSETKILGMYTPNTDVSNYATLDLEQRSIIARLATGDKDGLSEANDIYTNGRSGVNPITGGSGGGMTMQSLSTNALSEFTGVSATYQTFMDYYGDASYADSWVSASYGGLETTFTDSNDYNVDFRVFDIEGRAGKKITYNVSALSNI